MSGGYRIQRSYRDTDHPRHNATIATGLSLEEARAHCRDPKTRRTDDQGQVIWWDIYTDGHGDLERGGR